MTRPRLVYSWPTGGYPKPAFVNALSQIRMGQSLADHGPNDIMSAQAPVQMARTQLCVEAMKGGYDFIVMHDDDLQIGACEAGNPIDNSVAIMRDHPDVGLVGALYMRESPTLPTFVMRDPRFEVTEAAQGICGIPSIPFDCWGIGFGWVCIRVEAIRKLAELDDGPIVRFSTFNDVAGVARELGEDYDFCARLHGVGYRVIADPRYKTDHWKRTGVLSYVHDDWEAACQSTENPIKVPAPEGSKMIEINGITCLDITPFRFAEGEQRARERAEKAAASKAA